MEPKRGPDAMTTHHWDSNTNHLTFHERFSAADFDAGYNLRARRPDFEQTVITAWQAGSEAARARLDCELDHRYGSGERQRLDIFRCGDAAAATLVFFHGGYWKSGDKSIYSFIATPFTEAGVNVVVAGYDLCPAISVAGICEEARRAMAYLWTKGTGLGINPASPSPGQVQSTPGPEKMQGLLAPDAAAAPDLRSFCRDLCADWS